MTQYITSINISLSELKNGLDWSLGVRMVFLGEGILSIDVIVSPNVQ